jgi:phosphatidylglycerol:prolipoprotein diacylglycerol transferase
MKPILFELTLPVLGEIGFPAYMTLLTLGFVAAVWLGKRRGVALGLAGERVVDVGIVGLLAGIAGARLMSVLTDGYLMDFVRLCSQPRLVEARDRLVDICATDAHCGYDYLCDAVTNRCYPPRDCLAALKFWQGGLTFYGGVLAAVPAGMLWARRGRLGALRVADLAAPLVMLGLVFGRLGCFLNGCCWGAPTESWLGVDFGAGRERPGGPLHPTQLYEAAAAMALFALLSWRWRSQPPGSGARAGWLLVLYPAVRVIIEIFRADPRGAWGPLSTSQLLSLPLVIVGVWLITHARGHRRRAGANLG